MAQDLKARFDEHPYGTLAAALGAGYVLGGGFFTPLTARVARFVVRAGIRAAFIPFLTEQISELVATGRDKGAELRTAAQGRAEAPNQNAA